MCTSCPAGQDSQGGVTGCSNCEPGYYKTLDNSMCTLCPADQTLSAGATLVTDCFAVTGCNLGQGYNSATSACEQCADTHYKNVAGDAPCNPCGDNFQASTDRHQCKCKQGYFGPSTNGGVNCQMCNANTYSSSIGMSSCSQCPDESRSETGSTHLTDCVCGPGVYMLESMCQSCNEGKFKTGPGNTADLIDRNSL